ncbi:SubName: Full=Uncharacterized protein {ECO:0000313/EMBL:CCA74940.1} [Serendipita indica DSM 11827]|nr:SubName: Full=Uncharacterized protein {ECO:0000313/EMBL:CCA74940.1} [Serendipita indica DSM 11827]
MPAQVFTQLEAGLLSLQTASYVTSAAFSIWLWDILINLDVELTVLWRRKGGLLKTLYTLVRYAPGTLFIPNVYLYSPMRAQLSKKLYLRIHCYYHVSHSGVMQYFLFTAVRTAVFALRVYAIYRSIHWMRRLIVVVVGICHFAVLSLSALVAIDLAGRVIWIGPLSLCATPNPPVRLFSLFYGSTLVAELFLVLATLYHAICFRRDHPSLEGTATGVVVRTLHREGFSYFAFIFTSRFVICTLIWSHPSLTVLILVYIEFAVISTLTSRWILSFRQLAISFWEDPAPDGIQFTTATVTGIPVTTFGVVEHSMSFALWSTRTDALELTQSHS